MSKKMLDPASPQAVEEFKAMMQDPAARQAFIDLREGHREAGAKPRYEHVLRVVSERPWAIMPSYLAIITDVLAFRIAGGRFDQSEIDARMQAARQRPPVADSEGGVAVIPIRGVIAPRAGSMDEMSGGMSLSSFRRDFNEAMASSAVGSIVLDIDSPGGAADGVPEMADEIRGARGQGKRIVAVANTMAASAAYWLGSQADELVVTKSGRVGSIGVYTAHENRAAAMEREGVETTLVSAGKFKTEGNPFEPLTDEARDHMQTLVDEYYGMFVRAVAQGRGAPVAAVRDGFGEGRLKSASQAVKLGMADRVATVDQVVSELLHGSSATRQSLSAVEFEEAKRDEMHEESLRAQFFVESALPEGKRDELFEEARAAGVPDPDDEIELGVINVPVKIVGKVESEPSEEPDEFAEIEQEISKLSGKEEVSKEVEDAVVDPGTIPPAEQEEETSDESDAPESGDEDASGTSVEAEDEILIFETEIARLAE